MKEKILWKIKKYNSILLIILLLLETHFTAGTFLFRANPSFSDILKIYSNLPVKLIITLFTISLSLHIFTSIRSILPLYKWNRSKKEDCILAAASGIPAIIVICTLWLV